MQTGWKWALLAAAIVGFMPATKAWSQLPAQRTPAGMDLKKPVAAPAAVQPKVAPLSCTAPDKLEATGLSLNPPQPSQGQAVTVSMTVRNLCNTPLSNIAWRIVSAPEGSPLGSGTWPGPVQPGQAFTVTAPWTAVAGQRVLEGQVDPANAIGESGDGRRNNSRQVSVSIAGGALSLSPDLSRKPPQAKEGVAPSQPSVLEVIPRPLSRIRAGESITLGAAIKNLGPGEAHRVAWEVAVDGRVIREDEHPILPVDVGYGAGASAHGMQATWLAATGTHVITFSVKRAANARVDQNLTKTVTVQVQESAELALTAISLVGGPQFVYAPEGAMGEVALSRAASAGGVTLALSSSNTAFVSVPPVLTIPEGHSTATFRLTPPGRNAQGDAVVSATLAGRSVTLPVQVLPSARVRRVELSSDSIPGGGLITGVAWLNKAAPAGGVTALVELAGSDVSSHVEGQWPQNLVFAAGQSEARFQIQTRPVAQNWVTPVNVRNPAIDEVPHAQRRLTVTPAGGPQVTEIHAYAGTQWYSTSMVNVLPVGGGREVQYAFNLSAPVPATGTVVRLASSHPDVLPLPATVTILPATPKDFRGRILAGSATTRTVTATTRVTLTATAGGATLSIPLEVQPIAGLDSFAVAPAGLASGGVGTATVVLTQPAPQGGVTVNLSSSSNLATLPATLTIGAGQTSASFGISIGSVSASTAIAISASYGGTTKIANVSLRP